MDDIERSVFRIAFIAIAAVAALLVCTALYAGDWPSQNARGGVGFNLPGKPVTGTIQRVSIPWYMQVPTNYAANGPAVASVCSCKTAPTSSYVITIEYNDSTSEGACTIAGSANAGTFSSNTAFLMNPGDTLSIVAPTTDATASDCSVTIGVSQ